jgi:WD40 repeat protein
LRPFTEAESDLFFGREKHTAQLRSKLERNRFVAVVGSSGSGKSSLVRAGLIAQLKGLGDPDYAQTQTEGEQLRWRVAEMRPSGCPISGLARALVSPSALGPERALLFADLQEERRREALEGDAAFVAATLRRGPLGLFEVLRETSLPRDTRLLIFVDQFEEIFRFRNEGPANASPDSTTGRGAASRERWVNEAEAFVALLLATNERNDLGVHLLLTMRLDYLSDCAVFTGLPEAISRSQFLTPRLTREQRCASIVAPARLNGGDVAPDLVNTLLNDTGPESDQLPLLQHCLMRMWTIAQERSAASRDISPFLTMEHYRDERVGTIKSCLSNHANRVYVELEKRSARYGKIAETIFRCLTGQSADKPDTRRPQPWSALRAVATANGNSEEEVRVVLDAFRHADCCFLTPSLDTELESATPLDISHESLIRNWDKLQHWVKLESGSAEDYRSLEQSARRWKERRADLLDRLALESILRWKRKENPSAEWAARYGGDFQLAMEFLDLSQEAERKRKETERKRILRRRRYFITTAIAVLVVAGSFCYFAHRQASTEKALREVETQRLIEVTKRSDHFLELAQRLLNKEDDPKKDVTALHYLSRALHAYPRNAKAAELTRDLLCRNVWCSPLTRALRSEAESPLLSAAFGPEGQVFAVSSDGNFLAWNGDGSSLVRRQSLLSEESPSTGDNFVPNKANLAAACFSHDGERLLVISPQAPSGTTARAQVWSWSPQSASYERNCPSIEITDPCPYYNIVWSSDGSLLVIISRRDHPSYQIFQCDSRGYHDLQTPFGPGKVAAATFSADDKLLATVSLQGAVSLWDAATLKPATETAEVKGLFNLSSDPRPTSLAFVPDKSVLVMTSFSQPIQFLNIRTGELKQVSSQRTQDQVMRLVFTPQQAGKRLAVKTLNGRVEIAEASALDRPVAEPICFKGVVGCSRFSPDGKRILILSGPYWMAFDTVQLWDTDLQNSMLEMKQLPCDGTLAPSWLADLAEVESGPEGRNSDDDETPQTMEDIRKKYSSEQGGGTYQVIWQRFFPPEPSSHSS